MSDVLVDVCDSESDTIFGEAIKEVVDMLDEVMVDIIPKYMCTDNCPCPSDLDRN